MLDLRLIYNEYSHPSVFLAPAKLGRVPSGPTFEIEAHPGDGAHARHGRSVYSTPRSRAALHDVQHGGGTRLCTHFNGTLHSSSSFYLTQRGHLAYAPIQYPAAARFCPSVPHQTPPCRHPEPVVHLVPLLLSPIRQDEARRDPSAAPYQRRPHLPTIIAKHRTTPRSPK